MKHRLIEFQVPVEHQGVEEQEVEPGLQGDVVLGARQEDAVRVALQEGAVQVALQEVEVRVAHLEVGGLEVLLVAVELGVHQGVQVEQEGRPVQGVHRGHVAPLEQLVQQAELVWFLSQF